ncbi:tetratricopeptide repeat protein [Pseudomonas sp. Irchel 3A5]|uniref:tetratricopeptide repeat protein n=1 Tax=Pseudomonas sp. Irchel 3A5 TaxID=2008911 RepID=UPI00211536CF|nr:tetratricopeptide repeat protein [Pseudomonas sp. Irchel 3A5]
MISYRAESCHLTCHCCIFILLMGRRNWKLKLCASNPENSCCARFVVRNVMRIRAFKALLTLPMLFVMLYAQAAKPGASDEAIRLFSTEQFRASIEESDRVLKSDPTDTEALNVKALAVSMLGDDQAAIRLVTQALEIVKKDGQASITQQANYWNNLGYFNERQRNYQVAISCHEKALKMRLSAFGADNLQTADSYNNLGTTLSKLGRYDEAFDNLRKNLSLRKRLSGERDHSVAVALNNLGNAYNLQGDYKASLPLFQQALDIDAPLYGVQHPVIAVRWNNIGDAYRGLGQYDQAEIFLTKALNSDLASFGENHPKVSLRYFNLAKIYEAQGDKLKARDAYAKALQIVRNVDPGDAGQIQYFEAKLRELGAKSGA